MEDAYWWLTGTSFGLGVVLTFTLMVRPVKHHLPVEASVVRTSP